MNPESSPIGSSPANAGEPAVSALDAPSGVGANAERDWRYWMKRLLVCNPFFLCSAALLLFGVNRLSNDPAFLGDEVHNLLFNFFALQFYEVLVVVTALVLVRRKVWYDSALLAVMENGLVLVPFMLISQATMQNDGVQLAWSLTLTGGAVAAGRFIALKRCYPRFNLPWRALILGGAILGVNVALPLVFRSSMELDLEDWRGPNQFLWYAALPFLVAGANLLPRPGRYGGSNPERHWLPLFIYGLWVAGSGVHVWCIAHICGFAFELHYIAPAICTAGWTMWNRLADCRPDPSPRWQQVMLIVAAAAPLLGFADPKLMLVLVGLNLAGFIMLSFAGRPPTQATARELAFASAALMFAAIPVDWGREILASFRREHGAVFGVTLHLVLLAVRSKRPEAGLFGAIAAGIDAGWISPGASIAVGVEVGVIFLLLHSLRWTDWEHAGASLLRWLAAAGWVTHAVVWTHDGGWLSLGVTGGGALLVAAGWLVAWRLCRERGPWNIPAAATIAFLAGPGNALARSGSDGMLAMMGSFALFAIGIVVAWTRHRWDQPGTGSQE